MSGIQEKTALITGAGRGQGRAHAITLAAAGADIVAFDICADILSCPYPLSNVEDLDETARQVEALGRRVLTRQVDVRVKAEVEAGITDALARFGQIDIVVANAGICPMQENEPAGSWDDVIATNLTGAFYTVASAVPSMIERGQGGVIVLTGSTAALTSGYGITSSALAYQASKHGIIALMRGYAANLGRFGIRVNAVHPTVVDTVMAQNDAVAAYTAKYRESPGTSGGEHALALERLDPQEVANAVAFLASDEARYITGVNLPVDAGYCN